MEAGASDSFNLPPDVLPENAFGATVLGASKVFTLSTRGAVSVSPRARLNVAPETSRAISVAR